MKSNNAKKMLSKYRRQMENPYVGIELLEELSISPENPLPAAIRASRIELQNPYAYLDGDGGFSALLVPVADKSRVTHSFGDIEAAAIRLQRQMWLDREKIFSSAVSPIEILDPQKAAGYLDYSFDLVDSLGTYADRVERIEVAGFMDRKDRHISISKIFPPSMQRFTAAHEIGHLILHPQMEMVHRDRGVDAIQGGRIRVELEADKFAVYFLMPAKLVSAEFKYRFLTESFVLNEATSYALTGQQLAVSDEEKLVGRKLAFKMATATSYNGENFYSLAEYFGVSPIAMAIRLEELGLIARP